MAEVISSKGFGRLALRDGLLVVMAVGLWQFLAPLSAASGPLADFCGVVLGAVLALCFHLLHEWGHVGGAKLGGSVMQPAAKLSALSLFVYASQGNSRAQFLLMSVSGFAATGVAVWIAFAVLPDENLASRIARGYALIQVVLALVIELPLVFWALLARSLPPIDKPVAEVLGRR